MATAVEIIQGSPYFSGLSSSEINDISGLFFEKKIEKGEVVVWEGDPGEALYFVSSGAVKCFKISSEGKEQIIEMILPGKSFNDVSVFDGGPSPASAEAMSAVGIYGLSRDNVQRILKEYPKLYPNVIEVLTLRIRHLLGLVEDLSFRNVISRIARILIEHAEGAGPTPKLTQQEMAAIAGTAREVVGRSLKTLQEEGMIRMERNRLVISDKEALKKMAKAV